MPTQPDTEDGQSAFARALFDPSAEPPTDLAHIGGVVPRKRFNVYRNNVIVSLTESLAAAFPTVRKLVGEEFFRAMAGVYIRAHPPESPVMIHYGSRFPDWVAGFEPAGSVPYLADIARLERARRQAYHAADAVALEAEALSAIRPEHVANVVIDVHPSARVVGSKHPIFSIWRSVNGDETARPTAGHGEDVLVARPDETVEMRSLPVGAATFITSLSSGAALGEAAAAATQDNARFDLAQSIGGLLESRIMTGLRLGPDTLAAAEIT